VKPNVKAIGAVALSVGIATGFYGISFGALAITAGFDIWQTVALSVLMFSGGSQFAFVAVGMGDLATAVTSAWLVGVRNGFYALSMAQLIRPKGFKRLIAAQLTIDESAAVATAQDGKENQKLGFWLTGLSVFVLWNIATVGGAFLGGLIGDPKTFGLDAAAAAALFALVWPRLKTKVGAIVGAVALISSVALSLVLPAGPPVLLAALVAVVVGFAIQKRSA
jgi:predicted branched-subunit amino acid permease